MGKQHLLAKEESSIFDELWKDSIEQVFFRIGVSEAIKYSCMTASLLMLFSCDFDSLSNELFVGLLAATWAMMLFSGDGGKLWIGKDWDFSNDFNRKLNVTAKNMKNRWRVAGRFVWVSLYILFLISGVGFSRLFANKPFSYLPEYFAHPNADTLWIALWTMLVGILILKYGLDTAISAISEHVRLNGYKNEITPVRKSVKIR